MIKIAILSLNPEHGFMKFQVRLVIKKTCEESSHCFSKRIYKRTKDFFLKKGNIMVWLNII